MEEAWSEITLSSTPNLHDPEPANVGLTLHDLLTSTPVNLCLAPPPRATVICRESRDDKKYKRKMKNRASAARSRNRKMAYTLTLEENKARLIEENEMLKKEIQRQRLLVVPPGGFKEQPHGKRSRCKSVPF